jgi:hypothetical protein
MWQDIKLVYQTAWRCIWLLPLLFLISPVVEMAQHVVEIRTGMYDSLAAAKAVADGPLRMTFGFAKVIALALPTYWFIRLMAFGDPGRAAQFEWPAIGLWLVLFALSVVQQGYSLFGTPVGQVLGLSGKAAVWTGPVLALVWSLVGIYLMAWVVAWTLGNRAIGPVRSFSVMAGSFWRTLGYSVACILPLMAVHYALGYLAIALTPAWLDWPVLVLDALVVGLLACAMAGSSYIAARSAAARKNVDLAG